MSLFTQPTLLVPLHELKYNNGEPIDSRDERKWVVLNEDFGFEIGSQGSGCWVEVPYGFITDLASVPKRLWGVIAPHGLHLGAAVIHDYLYSGASELGLTRQMADAVFLDAMTVSGVPSRRKYLMWAAVRLFGSRNFRDPRPESEVVYPL